MSQAEINLSEFRHKTKIEVRWSDLDELAHVNNAVFLTYLEEARIAYLEKACGWDWRKDGIIVAHISIDYLSPLFYPFPTFCYVRCTKLGEKSFDLSYIITMEKGGKEIPVAKAKTIMVGFDFASGRSIVLGETLKSKFLAFEGINSISH